MFYEEGNHVTRDLAKAKSYYEKGCRGEEALACARIGLMYMQGNGVPQNYDLAFTYLEKSCQGALDDRNNAGCFGLARLYEQGLGCQQDKEQAVKLYRLTCYGVEPKNAEGCVKLAKAYQSGEGIEPDANAVHEYFRQACDLGSREGCVGRYTDECDRLKIPQACEWMKKEGLY
jgi:TPR repeat protein